MWSINSSYSIFFEIILFFAALAVNLLDVENIIVKAVTAASTVTKIFYITIRIIMNFSLYIVGYREIFYYGGCLQRHSEQGGY